MELARRTPKGAIWGSAAPSKRGRPPTNGGEKTTDAAPRRRWASFRAYPAVHCTCNPCMVMRPHSAQIKIVKLKRVNENFCERFVCAECVLEACDRKLQKDGRSDSGQITEQERPFGVKVVSTARREGWRVDGSIYMYIMAHRRAPPSSVCTLFKSTQQHTYKHRQGHRRSHHCCRINRQWRRRGSGSIPLIPTRASAGGTL